MSKNLPAKTNDPIVDLFLFLPKKINAGNIITKNSTGRAKLIVRDEEIAQFLLNEASSREGVKVLRLRSLIVQSKNELEIL